ncbi:unnamed protein product [Effrenium voratum]|nr:unnamed protein product [Effrenium voratum]
MARCEAVSSQLGQAKADQLVSEKSVGWLREELAETHKQLAAARAQINQLGTELRHQSLQNGVQVQRLDQALKERNETEVLRRKAEAQLQVLEARLAEPAIGSFPREKERPEEKEQKEKLEEVKKDAQALGFPVRSPQMVMRKSKLLEEQIMRKEADWEKQPQSPNSQMREKLEKARRRVEAREEATPPRCPSAVGTPGARPREPKHRSRSSSSTSTASLPPRHEGRHEKPPLVLPALPLREL